MIIIQQVCLLSLAESSLNFKTPKLRWLAQPCQSCQLVNRSCAGGRIYCAVEMARGQKTSSVLLQARVALPRIHRLLPAASFITEVFYDPLLQPVSSHQSVQTHISSPSSLFLFFSLVVSFWISLFVVRETHFSIYWPRSSRDFQFHRAWKCPGIELERFNYCIIVFNICVKLCEIWWSIDSVKATKFALFEKYFV